MTDNDNTPASEPPPPEIIKTELTLHLGATVAVTTSGSGWQDFIKPSASFSTSWGGVPTEDQVRAAAEFTRDHILSPLLDEIISTAMDRLVEARRGTT